MKKLMNPKSLVIALIVGIVITSLSGFPRYAWSSPGGSAYDGGLPIPYHAQYCGGYAPCYWTAIYWIAFVEDLAFWVVVAFATLAAAARLYDRRSMR